MVPLKIYFKERWCIGWHCWSWNLRPLAMASVESYTASVYL